MKLWIQILWLRILAFFTPARSITKAGAARLTAAADHNTAFRNSLERQIRERATAGFSTLDLPHNIEGFQTEVWNALRLPTDTNPEVARGFDINELGRCVRISWHSER